MRWRWRKPIAAAGYRATDRVSAAQRDMRQLLRTRRLLVQMRSSTVESAARAGAAIGRAPGERQLRDGADAAGAAHPADGAAGHARAVSAADRRLTEELHTIDARVKTQVAGDAVVARLQTVPGVGLIVATTFRAFIDTRERFADASQVSAAIGLVPHEDSSAERRHRGHITKAGPRELRSLFVQAAWVCWRSPRSATLRAWVERLAARRGKRIAVVALARRLSRILYAIWRDGTTFERRTDHGVAVDDWRCSRGARPSQRQ